jgi:molybdopterin synthase sulfur carrier subunit
LGDPISFGDHGKNFSQVKTGPCADHDSENTMREQRAADPTITVHLPHQLRARTNNQRMVIVSACTVREVLDVLDYTFPGLRFNLCYETGELRPYVNVFLDGENVRYLRGLDTPIAADATIHIVHSVAGG